MRLNLHDKQLVTFLKIILNNYHSLKSYEHRIIIIFKRVTIIVGHVSIKYFFASINDANNYLQPILLEVKMLLQYKSH